MDDLTYFAGVSLRVLVEWSHKWNPSTTSIDKEMVCKEAWEWARAMQRNGPYPLQG